MAYTTIDKSTAHFNTKLFTGNGGSNRGITGVGFQPDWVWLKTRTSRANSHVLIDAVRGTNRLRSDSSAAQASVSGEFISFDSDGFTLTDNASNELNYNSVDYVTWNWLAGGTAPAITYTVKVVSDSGNKYRFDDFGTSAVTLDLQEGGTYTFDQSDSSNSGHPLRFYTASDKSGGEYTTGVTTTGTPGSSGAQTVITVASGAPTLYYQCSSHAGMGGQANTNSTFGSSNFSGSIQSTVSVNTTAGFSIVSYTGNGSTNQTVGHGLGVKPAVMIFKNRDDTNNWVVYHQKLNNGTNPEVKYLELNTNNAQLDDASIFNDTAPTSTLFTVGNASDTGTGTGGNNEKIIAYCFAEKTGYSKFGAYEGNGNTDGTFVYTGFKPSWLMVKRYSGGTNDWLILDNKRDPINQMGKGLLANSNNTEATGYHCDFLSNGFKFRLTGSGENGSNFGYSYMAFGQTIVGSNNIPATAR